MSRSESEAQDDASTTVQNNEQVIDELGYNLSVIAAFDDRWRDIDVYETGGSTFSDKSIRIIAISRIRRHIAEITVDQKNDGTTVKTVYSIHTPPSPSPPNSIADTGYVRRHQIDAFLHSCPTTTTEAWKDYVLDSVHSTIRSEFLGSHS